MADVLTPQQRSFNMSSIRSKNTKPEMIVRRFLFSKGLRYRINDKRYPGHPDIVLPKYKTIIFIHGCFWHRHPGCHLAHTPDTNIDYWEKKFAANISRDHLQQEELEKMGWHVIVVWECQLQVKKREDTLICLYNDIINH